MFFFAANYSAAEIPLLLIFTLCAFMAISCLFVIFCENTSLWQDQPTQAAQTFGTFSEGITLTKLPCHHMDTNQWYDYEIDTQLNCTKKRWKYCDTFCKFFFICYYMAGFCLFSDACGYFWIISWGKYLWCSKTLFKLGCYMPALNLRERMKHQNKMVDT